MAQYHVTSPDGGTYEINAPDDATEDQIISYAQQNFNAGSAPKPTQSAPQSEYVGDSHVKRADSENAKASINDLLASTAAAIPQAAEGMINIPTTLANIGIRHAGYPEYQIPTWRQMIGAASEGQFSNPDFANRPQTYTEDIYQPKTGVGQVANVVTQALVGNRLGGVNVANKAISAGAPLVTPATAAVSGLGALAGSNLAPQGWEDVGGLVGGIVAPGVKSAAEAGYSGVKNVGKNLGLGKKEEIAPGIKATPRQQELIGREIIGSAKNPEYVRNMLGLDPNAETPAQPFVSGSKPSLAESMILPDVEGNVGDPGITGWQKGVRAKNVEQFNEKKMLNTKAQNETLRGMMTEGNPEDVGTFFQNQQRALQDQQNANVSGAQKNVGRAIDAVGRPQDLDAIGQTIRQEQVVPKFVADNAAESQLWNKIKPFLPDQLEPSKAIQAASDIAASINKAKGAQTLTPEEAPLIASVKNWSKGASFQDARDLLSSLHEARRSLVYQYGKDSQPIRRIGQLQSSIEGMLENNLSNAESAKAAQAAAPQPYKPPRSYNDMMTGKVEPEPVPQQQFGPEGQQLYRDARTYTREQKQFYGQPVMADILAPGKNGQQYRVQDAQVPYRVFNARPTSAGDIAAYLDPQRGGGNPQTLHDIAFAKMRDAGVIGEDGLIKPTRFESFTRAHRDAIDATPGLSDKLQNLKAAQDVFDARVAERDAVMQDFNKSQAGQFISKDPQEAVASAFSGNDSAKKLSQLADTVRRDPAARDGLRRAAAQHILENIRKAKDGDTTGLDIGSPKSFRTFMSKNGQGLEKVFDPQQKLALDSVLSDMRRSAINEQQSMLAGQSNTAPMALAAAKQAGSVMDKMGSFLKDRLKYATTGTATGAFLGGVPGAIAGGIAGELGGALLSAVKQRNITTLEQLRLEAALNPELARILVSQAPTKLTVPIQNRIARALVKGIPSNVISTSAAQQNKEKSKPMTITIGPRGKETDLIRRYQ